MTLAEANKLPLGLYFFEWHTGGGSVVALGMDAKGCRWVAPTNWSFPTAWTADDWVAVKSARLITTQAGEVGKMKPKTKPITRIATCEHLKKWFTEQEAKYTTHRGLWEVCVDSGSCYLRYVGSNEPGMEPHTPFQLDLDTGSSLIVELMHMVGIPASRA